MKKLFQKFISPVRQKLTQEQRDVCDEFLRGVLDLRRFVRGSIDSVVKHFAKASGGDGLPLRYDDCEMCAESIFKNLKKDFLSYAHKHGIKGFK